MKESESEKREKTYMGTKKTEEKRTKDRDLRE